jgi:hypothetical protein
MVQIKFLVSNSTPTVARWVLTNNEEHIPAVQSQLIQRLINRIEEIHGEGSDTIRRWLCASVIVFIWTLIQGTASPGWNANRFLAQISNYDVESTLRNEILQFGFEEVEEAQIPWYSDEGAGENDGEIVY